MSGTRWLARSVPRLDSNERLLAVLFLCTLPLVNPYIRGDGNGYYAYVRSAVIDGDLDFENEYRQGDPAFQSLWFGEDGHLRPEMVTPTGHFRNQWSVGPSLLWGPPFLAAHALVRLSNHFGMHVAADGYSLPYRYACALSTAVYGFIALLFSYRITRRLCQPCDARLAVFAIWFGSSLPVYMYFLPFHVHALAALAVSVYLWYWLRSRPERSKSQWFMLGLLGGLMIEVYYLNAIFLLLALADVWYARGAIESNKPRTRLAVLRALVALLLLAGSVMLVLVPHFVAKAIIYGSPWRTGYDDQFFWTSPRLWQVGFSTEHGMFLWTPVLVLASLGLVRLTRRDATVGWPLLGCLAVFYYTVASYQNWHGQSSFGSRFFVSWTPVFVLGLGVLLRDVREYSGDVTGETPTRKVQFRTGGILFSYALLGLLALWNVGFIFQWGTNLVPNRGAVDFAAMSVNQITVVPRRVGSFLVRYFTARARVTREVEQQDEIERLGYNVSR